MQTDGRQMSASEISGPAHADNGTALWYSSVFSQSGSESVTSSEVPDTDVDRLIWAYCSPPVFVIGIVGNLLTVLVTGRRPTRSTSSGVYLLGMSLAAIGVYLSGFLTQWLRSGGFVDVTELGPWSCRLNKFVYYSSGDVVIWTLCLLNVDRLVAVCLPLRKADICTRRRAVALSSVVVALTVAKNLHIFWTRGTVYDAPSSEVRSHCGAPEPHTNFEVFVRPWIVFAVVTVLPVAIIITCNTLIVWQLARGRTIRRNVGGGALRKKKPGTRMTTTMCLGASLSFVFFASPSIVLVILHPYYPGVPYDIAKAVNNLLVYVNYAANFFLYCLGGHSFRSRLRLLFLDPCCRSNLGHFRFNRSTMYSAPSSNRRGVSDVTGSSSTKSSRFNSTLTDSSRI